MNKLAIAILLVATSAYAEELVLHAQDSITIEGQRYTWRGV